ncbi:DUF1062 domain-containing protein, partial [Ensifer sp. SSB1]|uniref:DUF1062 domain-containing protein n=1 Tax=Ensifer sp. SSB1 TaxID=2795385 RepID=UPI001A575898
RDISPETLDALQNNDPGWVRRVSFDVEGLRRESRRIEEFADCRVAKRVLAEARDACSHLELVVHMPLAVSIRADRLLSAELGLSRRRLTRLEEEERLTLQSSSRKALQRPIRDGLRVVVDLSEERDHDEIADRARGILLPA